MRVHVHDNAEMTTVRNEQPLTVGTAYWSKGARCGVLVLAGDGVAFNLHLTEGAINNIVQTGLGILKERYRITEEASRGNSHN